MVTNASLHFKIPFVREFGKKVFVKLLESREKAPLNKIHTGNRQINAHTDASKVSTVCFFLRFHTSSPPTHSYGVP